MSQGTEELFPDPGQLHTLPVDKLLAAAARGYVGVDHRFLHAILDRGENSIPHLVRFAGEDHDDDAVELDEVLLDIFRVLHTPHAVPFLIELVRRDPTEVSDELVEAIAQQGAAAVDALLRLLKEIEEQGKEPGDVPFLLSQLGVRDPRIFDALTAILAKGEPDAALFLDMYGDPAGIPALEAALERLPEGDIDQVRIRSFIKDLSESLEDRETPVDEKFDIWALYPEQEPPPLHFLEEEDRLRMLSEGPAESRIAVAVFYRSADVSDRVAARLIEHAKSDPDSRVRGECWEALQDHAYEPEMRRTMLAVLKDPGTSIEEKGGVAVALALQTDNPVVYQAIESLYADPRGRAKALKAMGRSFDKRFSLYPPLHLDDPDPDIKRQAIWATGYLDLSSEAPRLEVFFEDDKFRGDALFAYALSVPGETSRGRIQALMDKVSEAAGGFRPDEEALVEVALDQRLMMHGKEPVFTVDDSEELEDAPEDMAVSKKVGRNDPCPCGSGKKYKKCCGA